MRKLSAEFHQAMNDVYHYGPRDCRDCQLKYVRAFKKVETHFSIKDAIDLQEARHRSWESKDPRHYHRLLKAILRRKNLPLKLTSVDEC